MQAAVLRYKAAETGVIMRLGTVWKYASIYMLHLESGAHIGTAIKKEVKHTDSVHGWASGRPGKLEGFLIPMGANVYIFQDVMVLVERW